MFGSKFATNGLDLTIEKNNWKKRASRKSIVKTALTYTDFIESEKAVSLGYKEKNGRKMFWPISSVVSWFLRWLKLA